MLNVYLCRALLLIYATGGKYFFPLTQCRVPIMGHLLTVHAGHDGEQETVGTDIFCGITCWGESRSPVLPTMLFAAPDDWARVKIHHK